LGISKGLQVLLRFSGEGGIRKPGCFSFITFVTPCEFHATALPALHDREEVINRRRAK
jgi:hypothetical protein